MLNRLRIDLPVERRPSLRVAAAFCLTILRARRAAGGDTAPISGNPWQRPVRTSDAEPRSRRASTIAGALRAASTRTGSKPSRLMPSDSARVQTGTLLQAGEAFHERGAPNEQRRRKSWIKGRRPRQFHRFKPQLSVRITQETRLVDWIDSRHSSRFARFESIRNAKMTVPGQAVRLLDSSRRMPERRAGPMVPLK